MSLPSLPADALVSVLCRCPAADHPALRRTCRAVRAALDSDAYKSERALGWAEVETRLIPGSELYDREHPDGPDVSDVEEGDSLEEKKAARRTQQILECYPSIGKRDFEGGCIDITHEVKVDGVASGSIAMVLAPRIGLGSRGEFHDATSAHSRELQQVGWTVCDAHGRPKIRSIWNADLDGRAGEGGFLHVVRVRLDSAYRAGDSTSVVARAVRSALLAPELKDRWTLATAISDFNVYMNPSETRLLREQSSRRRAREHGLLEDGGASAEEDAMIMRRYKECQALDARTFVRVGYRQLKELVGSDKDKPPWLFALPRFLEEPLLTAEGAADIEIRVPPELPPKPRGVDNDLLQLFIRSSNEIRRTTDQLKGAERRLARIKGKNAVALEMHASMLSELQREREENIAMIAQFRDLIAERETIVAQADEVIAANEGQSAAAGGREALSGRKREAAEAMGALVAEKEQARKDLQTMKSNLNSVLELDKKMKGKMSSLESTVRETQAQIDAQNKTMDDDIAKVRQTIVDATKATALEANDLVEKGASVRRSFAIHCASRFRLATFVDSLLELTPAGERALAISDIDSGGITPLHSSVMGTPEFHDTDEYYAFVRHLLSLGADSNARDTFDMTALGQYRSIMNSKLNFTRVYSTRPEDDPAAWRDYHNRMEGALRPTRGETDADRDAMPLAFREESMEVDNDEEGDDDDGVSEGDGNMSDGDDDVDG